MVFHWYEMSDAVQDETYTIDDVELSNFVLPLYFTRNNEKGARNDFLGTVKNGKTLKSFGVNPGGYVGFFDPELGKHDTFAGTHDDRSPRSGRRSRPRRPWRAARCATRTCDAHSTQVPAPRRQSPAQGGGPEAAQLSRR